MQIREGFALEPIGSVKDKILCKFLINERLNDNLKTIMLICKETMKPQDLLDMFREFYYRNLNREHKYSKDKAREVLKMSDTLEEAKKIINK